MNAIIDLAAIEEVLRELYRVAGMEPGGIGVGGTAGEAGTRRRWTGVTPSRPKLG